MTLSEYLAQQHGRASRLAAAIGVSNPAVSDWGSGKCGISAEHGAAIERATGGQVTRQELFPDTWERIWPELAASSSDIHVVRRSQLRMLIEQRAAGNIAAFAEQFGYSRSRISQFLSDTYNEGRSIGERAARALEEAAGLAFGWLDQIPAKTVFDAAHAGKFSGVSTTGQAADRFLKTEETSSTDYAAELRGAIAQTRLVFEGHRDARDALEYLEQVLKAGQRAEVPAHACEPPASQAICNLAIKIDTSDLDRATALANQFNEMLQGWAPALAKLKDSIATTMSATAEKAAAMAAESAQLVIQAEKAAAGAAARATVDPVAVLSRELFSLADKLHQPADLVVQLLVLAELRGMRAEQASDRFARGAAVLS